jgi:hypothetical protein
MSHTLANRRPNGEVKSLHPDAEPSEDTVKNLHLGKLNMAKVKVGEAFAQAIGDQSLKAFGHEGLVSGVVSGAKVPDYLARIYEDPAARRRFALALLEDDARVRVKTVVEWDEEKVG